MRLFVLVLSLTLLAAACGGEETPVFAGEPSGRIAFASDRDGNTEIYVLDLDSGQLTNLTHHRANDAGPAWSPDGGRIAFASFRGGQPDLYVMDADGSNLRRLTDDPALEGDVAWSPDGEYIAYSSARDPRQGFLWVAAADGSGARPVLADLSPAEPETPCAGGMPGSWFPDGETILYRGSQASISALQICSVKRDGSDVRLIYGRERVSSEQPRLSPDGRYIVFRSNEIGNFEIYVIRTDGSGLRRLTFDPGDDRDPVWSPDGQWIAFASDRDGDYDIYIMRPDGSDLRRLTDSPAIDLNPSWAP